MVARQCLRAPSLLAQTCHELSSCPPPLAGKTAHGDTGDIADDSYHRFDTDLRLMQALGVNTYRMSIAWPRIIPDGVGAVNPAGIVHYQQLFDQLSAAGEWGALPCR